MSENATYTVGRMARLAGVTVRTLHHYDEIGLVPPTGRAANGYRTYTDVDVARLQRIAETVRKTMEAHQMGIRLTPEELLEVFGEDDPSVHAAEAEQRWGDTEPGHESARRTSGYGTDDWTRIRRESETVEEAFADALSAGEAPDSPPGLAAARAHRDHITRWFYDVSPQLHQGLAQLYVEDARFAAHYDRRAPGLAAFVSAAIHALYR